MQAFDGLGPEVINSRLAMLGFAIAAFWELTQGINVFQQVDKYPLITIATFVTFTVASWIPFMQGQSYNVKSGPFTPAVSDALLTQCVTSAPRCFYCSEASCIAAASALASLDSPFAACAMRTAITCSMKGAMRCMRSCLLLHVLESCNESHRLTVVCCAVLCCPALSVPLQLEVTLGRIAMIGFVGLILNEAYFQRPFFPHLF
jgi:hypothetical protein